MSWIRVMMVSSLALAVAPNQSWSGAPVQGPNSDFPDASLVLPFDASANHTTFLSISNIGGGQVSSMWVFYNENGTFEGRVTRDVLGEGGTDVVDVLNVRDRTIDANGNIVESPPRLGLGGRRGFAVVFGDGSPRLIGNFTLANTSTLSAFGSAAVGLGAIGAVVQGSTLLGTTFNPNTLEDSELIVLALNATDVTTDIVSLTNGTTPAEGADLLDLSITLHSNLGDGVLATGDFAITGTALFSSLAELFSGQSLNAPATIDVSATEGADYRGSTIDPDSDDMVAIIGWFGEAVGSFGAAQTLRSQ